MSLDQATFAFVDLETTGLDASRDRVVQICIERTTGRQLDDRLESFVRSDRTGGEDIHHILPSQTVSAPTFAGLADRVLALLADAIFVAHGAPQDVAFLQHELRRAGREWSDPRILDTLVLARRAMPSGRHGLVALSRSLEIDNPQPHRADNDVRVLRELFERLVGQLGARSAGDLLQLQTGDFRALEANLVAAEQALHAGRPVAIRYRPAGRAAEWIQFCVTGVRRNLDPPRVLGYLHRTRGRRELHGNRILAIEPVGRE